jgi:hypothetical protein
MVRQTRAALVAALVGIGAPAVRAMTIVVTPDAGLAANPAAVAAFGRAAQAWSNVFSNDITINISAGLSNSFSNPSVIGNTSSVKFQAGYDFFMGKIKASADADDGIVASLPDLAHFSATLPAGFTFNGSFISTKANFKALGYMKLIDLDAVYGANDATITFNSNFAFDYDNSNGVGANAIDFQSVATHEIGHALGFLSQVDTVDALKHLGTVGNIPISPLDLFRFQNNAIGKDPATLADFTNFPRYLDTGGAPIFDDLTLERLMSTGVNFGDAREASHWKDDGYTGQLLGVMDPSINFGVTETISANDIRALDLIGYDFAPEPSALGLVASGMMLMPPRARRLLPRRPRGQ